jgi:hypothetical protein
MNTPSSKRFTDEGALPVLAAALCWFAPILLAEPQPGDLFREYLWTNEGGDAGGSLRVGGRVGYGGGPVVLPHTFDLDHATRAEIVIEKLLCHDSTRGLAISVNSNAWIEVPEAPGIPAPQWEYQHHTYPVIPVPLDHLKAEGAPQFRMRVSDEHPWNWPQHLIYGVHVRIYYDARKKAHPFGRLLSPQPGEALGRKAELEAAAASPNGPIRQIDFLGHYEDVNWEGDGEYTRWHYHYVRAQLAGQLGSVTEAPWRIVWDTSWTPDQPKPFRLAARITDVTDLTYFTPSVDGLTFHRVGFSVELCKPYDIPKKWVTRAGEKSERFSISGDLENATAAQLAWVSWSPGYLHGISINGRQVFEREGPRYAYYAHRVPLRDLGVLRPGENTLTTALTPKYNGKMVHGTEINWPGIMVLLQYRTSP